MFQDFKDLLSAFNAHGVKYLIVGGYAVSFHAQPRATKYIDLFIKADAANAKVTYAALTGFGASLDNDKVRAKDLADPHNFIRFGREPVAVDIHPRIDGVEFDAAWERRVEGIVDAQSGLTAFFISKEDLVASKVAAGRMRDLADVEEIREATGSQRPPAKQKSPKSGDT